MSKRQIIVIPDPHGYVAEWLNATHIPGAELRVTCTGPWRKRWRFKRDLHALAKGKRKTQHSDPESVAPARVAREAEQGTCNAQAVGSTPTSGSGDPASCGHPNPVWFTDSHLWNEVMAGHRDGESPDILCPSCFADRADEHFAKTRGGWRITSWRMVPEWSRAPLPDELDDAGKIES